MLPRAGQNYDRLAGLNLAPLGVDVHLALTLQDKVDLGGGFQLMRERCLAGRKHCVGDAVGKVQPFLARMKKLAEISIIRRLKVSAICQIFYDHLSTTMLCSLLNCILLAVTTTITTTRRFLHEHLRLTQNPENR